MTGNDVIEEVLRLLDSGSGEEMNMLQSPVSSGATSLTFVYDLGGIRSGSYLSIDLETYRVWSVSGQTAIVQPAMQGTTTSSHAGQALVYVNPRFTRAAIFKALNDEIKALSSVANGLYQVQRVEFTYAGAQTDYNLDTAGLGILDVVDVRMWMPGPEQDWRPMANWSLKPMSDNTAFPSNFALHLPSGLPGRTIEVLCKTPFTPFGGAGTVGNDLATYCGLADEMQDIPALGVLLRLGPAREIKRNFTESQGDTRRSEEIGAGAVNASFNPIRILYQQRIAAEAARLAQKYQARHR